jgi:hypothetical protein
VNTYEDPREIIRKAFEARRYSIDRLQPIIRAAEQENAKLVDFWTHGEKHDAIGGTIRVGLNDGADSVGKVVSTLLADYETLQLSLTVNVAPYNPAADVSFTSVRPFWWHPGQPSLDALMPDR